MSEFREYICSESSGWDFGEDGKPRFKLWRGDEEVIRCRECEKFETVDCAVYRALRADSRIDSKGMFNPNGFCAWAERLDCREGHARRLERKHLRCRRPQEAA